MKAFVLLVTTLLAGAACDSSNPVAPDQPPTPAPATAPTPAPVVLAGDWQRINSTFPVLDGMRVRVGANGRRAHIVSMPANPFQFRVGDLKWRNITRVSATRFSFEDLVRQSGSGAPSYVAGFIDADANGTVLRLSFPTTGTFQDWRQR